MPLIMMILLAGAFWLMVMRPAKARQQAQRTLMSQLAVGQEVMTTAGLFGVVREMGETDVKLEIADGVVVRYVKEAIARVVEPSEPAATDSTPTEPTAVEAADQNSTIVLEDQSSQTRAN